MQERGMVMKKDKIFRLCYKIRFGICFGLAAAFFTGSTVVLPPAAVYAEDYTDVFYEGIADGKVNVRVAPGQDNEQVTHNGEKVQLKAGNKVAIIGEEMVGDKAWYKIRFTIDGDEIVGYCTSSYVTKTKTTITPTPTPSPTPSPSPSPSPTPTESPNPTQPDASSAPTDSPDKDGDKSGKNTGIIIAMIVVVVAGGALVFLKSRKAQVAGRAASRKMAQLKKMKIEEEESDENNSRGRRKPEVKMKTNYRESQAEQVFQDVYVKRGMEEEPEEKEDRSGNYAYIDQGGSEEIKANAVKESEERRALREEIEELREHDLVIHKYFGKGEVYDNSDVRLIEVRFGGDVRFMNKDALAAKKLMRRCSDDIRLYRRNTERPRDDHYE